MNTDMPANLLAEKSLLGAMLIDSAIVNQSLALMPSNPFFAQRHTKIYNAMLELVTEGMPIDYTTLAYKLPDPADQIAVADLLSSTPTSINWEYYLRIVDNMARRRSLIASAQKMAEDAYNLDADIAEIEAAAAKATTSRVSKLKGPRHIKEGLEGVVQRLDYIARNPDATVGIPTTFLAIDKIIKSLRAGDVFILAGRPAMGKTALALDILLRMLMNYEINALFFSLEMTMEQLAERALANVGKLPSTRIHVGELYDDEWNPLLEAANKIANRSLYVDDQGGIDIDELFIRAIAHQERYGLDIVFIDYIGLITAKALRNANRQEQVSYISSRIKELAKLLNVPIVVLSQLSRKVEERADKRPIMSDLRDSGSIEQDADIVGFIYREDYYVEDSEKQGITEVIIGKHRHGGIGTASLFFVKEQMSFTDLAYERITLDY